MPSVHRRLARDGKQRVADALTRTFGVDHEPVGTFTATKAALDPVEDQVWWAVRDGLSTARTPWWRRLPLRGSRFQVGAR